jgi:hypothetical protein
VVVLERDLVYAPDSSVDLHMSAGMEREGVLVLARLIGGQESIGARSDAEQANAAILLANRVPSAPNLAKDDDPCPTRGSLMDGEGGRGDELMGRRRRRETQARNERE